MSSCFHEQPGNIRRFQVGRVSYFGLQCPTCLRLVGPKLDPGSLDEGEGQLIPGEIPRAEAKRSFQGGGNSKKKSYKAYLRSPAWKAKRDERLQLDNWVCTYCGVPTGEVDHISYENFGNEKMEDLRSSCSDCNQQARQDRIGS